MNKVRTRFLKSDFGRNIAVMFSGNGVAMILPFILAPFIARIYTPEDFAGYELFVKILTLFAVVSSLRFEMAILLPSSEKESNGLTKLSFELLIVFSILSALVIPFRQEIGQILDNQALASLLWLLPLAVFVTGAIKILIQVLIRRQQFKVLATNKIIASGGNNGSKFLLGLEFPMSLGLVWGHILGLVLPILALFRRKAVQKLPGELRKLKSSRKSLFAKYRDFPMVNTFHVLVEEGQEALLLFLISAYYGEITIGVFAFAMRYLRIPLAFFGSSLSQVLNEKLARERNAGIAIRPTVTRIVVGLAAVCIVPFTLLFFFGEPIFTVVFSAEWSAAGRYAQYLAPWLFLYFIETPLSMLPLIVDRQRRFFTINSIGHFLTLGVVAWLGFHHAPFERVLIWFSGLQSLFLLILILWFVYIAGGPKFQFKETNETT